MAQLNTSYNDTALLIGLNSPVLSADENSTDETLDELELLLETAGGHCFGRVLQYRESPEPKTFIGSGKLQEIKEIIEMNSIGLLVFDNEISPSQKRIIEETTNCYTIDRCYLILDIFASRAKTREGRLQVEYAQYKYLLPRLTGMWKHLVRQTSSGGRSPIGTRGPGETQLETDRRQMNQKIQRISNELSIVRKNRMTQRRQRLKNKIPLVSIVGYTNAGKSTLLNTLTDSRIEANDRLFDTLDTTTRILYLQNKKKVLVSDTVGFIRKLPHQLIDAFRATLEELEYADVLLHVIDASNPSYESQIEVVDQLIRELVKHGTKCIRVYNKIDRCPERPYINSEESVCISAKEKTGIDELLALIASKVGAEDVHFTGTIPYTHGNVVSELKELGIVNSIEYEPTGVYIDAVVSRDYYQKLLKIISREEENE